MPKREVRVDRGSGGLVSTAVNRTRLPSVLLHPSGCPSGACSHSMSRDPRPRTSESPSRCLALAPGHAVRRVANRACGPETVAGRLSGMRHCGWTPRHGIPGRGRGRYRIRSPTPANSVRLRMHKSFLASDLRRATGRNSYEYRPRCETPARYMPREKSQNSGFGRGQFISSRPPRQGHKVTNTLHRAPVLDPRPHHYGSLTKRKGEEKLRNGSRCGESGNSGNAYASINYNLFYNIVKQSSPSGNSRAGWRYRHLRFFMGMCNFSCQEITTIYRFITLNH